MAPRQPSQKRARCPSPPLGSSSSARPPGTRGSSSFRRSSRPRRSSISWSGSTSSPRSPSGGAPPAVSSACSPSVAASRVVASARRRKPFCEAVRDFPCSAARTCVPSPSIASASPTQPSSAASAPWSRRSPTHFSPKPPRAWGLWSSASSCSSTRPIASACSSELPSGASCGLASTCTTGRSRTCSPSPQTFASCSSRSFRSCSRSTASRRPVASTT